MASLFVEGSARPIGKTLDSNDQNQVADQRFSLKKWFSGGAQSGGLRKLGCGHCYLRYSAYRVFSRDVTAAMLVYINNGTAAMFVNPTNPPGIDRARH